MKIRNASARLFSLWGTIDRQHCQLIGERVTGGKILDVGCGYGSLTNFLTNKGYDVEGIDYEEESVETANRLFPNARVRLANAESFNEYPSRVFDTLVLKDSLHHFLGEGDIKASFANFRRILKEGGRIVVFDPNPQWFLRVARKIAFHEDPEAPLETAVGLLKEEGFAIRGIEFYETIGLALSGGYVGVRLVPNLSLLNRCVATVNKWLSGLITRLCLGRLLCWRYLIYADLMSDADRKS